MIVKIKAGTTFRIVSTVWLDNKITLANITGSVVTVFFKRGLQDGDASAVIKKDNALIGGVTFITPLAGKLETLILASDTNRLMNNKLYVEVLVKMADGNYIRSETDEVEFERNIINTLT